MEYSLSPYQYGAPAFYKRPFDEIVPYDPLNAGFNLVDRFSRQQAQLVNSSPAIRNFAPLLSADLIESETDYHVHIDLPGVDKSDLDIGISDGLLQIRAQRKEVHELNTDTVHQIERNFGKIQRSLKLPSNADTQAANAQLKDGVLWISFPKSGPSTTRKLLIE